MDQMWAPWRLEYVSGETSKIEGCVFCEIVKEKDDSVHHVIYRGKYCYAVLNKFPYNNGHVMVIPYRHTDDLLALTKDISSECNELINRTIKALREVFNPQGINLGLNMGMAAGAGIAEHIHYHILPRWQGDTNFMPVIAGTKVISESLNSTFKKLKAALKD